LINRKFFIQIYESFIVEKEKALVVISLIVSIISTARLPLVLADPEPGVDGVLYVYTDSGYSNEAPWYGGSPDGHSYVANIGDRYWIKVTNIDDPKGVEASDMIEVKVCYTDISGNPAYATLGITVIQDGGWFAIGPWTVPNDAKVCTTTTVHFYKIDASGNKVGEEWVAGGQFFQVGHMHVVPEVTFGILGSLIVCMAALVTFSGFRKKNPTHVSKV
jgi:hypothetical protein